MDETAEAGEERFIYTNWQGRSFLVDERFANDYREYFLKEGFRPEEVALLTPERIARRLPEIESDALIIEVVCGTFTA